MNHHVANAIAQVDRIARTPDLPPGVSNAAGLLYVALDALAKDLPQAEVADWVSPFVEALRETLGVAGTSAPAALRALKAERDDLRVRVQQLGDEGRRALGERDNARAKITTLEGEAQGLMACLDAVREALALPEGEPAPYGELAGHVEALRKDRDAARAVIAKAHALVYDDGPNRNGVYVQLCNLLDDAMPAPAGN